MTEDVGPLVTLLSDVGAPAVFLAAALMLWRQVQRNTALLERLVERCFEERAEAENNPEGTGAQSAS